MESKANIWTPERTAAAAAEIERWKGTPHRDRMAKPGVGIDCIGLTFQVLQAAEITPPFQMPYYSPRWGMGRAHNIMEGLLRKCLFCEPIKAPIDWKPGDLLIFRVGRQSNHIGIFWQEGERLGVWHSRARAAVEFTDYDLTLAKTVQTGMRINAPGFRTRPEDLTPADFKNGL